MKLKYKSVYLAIAVAIQLLSWSIYIPTTIAGGSKADASASKINAKVLNREIFNKDLASNSFQIDNKNSNITFTIFPPIGKIHGKVKEVNGFYSMGTSASNSQEGHVEILVEKMTTNAKYRDKIMKEEVLEVSKYPLIGFRILETKIICSTMVIK